MTVIPCQQNRELRDKIKAFAGTLETEAHTLGDHGLSEHEFYASGLFRGAIERLRGQFAATMRDKRTFVRDVLNYMQDRDFIKDWESAGEANRHDYSVYFHDGHIAVIELKGCLDGNNTNIFERPSHANEFIIWSICTNAASDPRRNVWSGIHTRLSAEIISRNQQVDGAIIWDMMCGTVGRPCPKLMSGDTERITEVSQYRLPPPCIYVFPSTVASTRNNPHPSAQLLNDVRILKAFHECFSGRDYTEKYEAATAILDTAPHSEVNYVDFELEYHGSEKRRTTTVRRNGIVQKVSQPTAIRRS